MDSQPPPATLLLAPIILILSAVSVCIGIIVIVLTSEFAKAKTVDRQDKLLYISEIWVGTRSGFLKTLFLLWCPVLLVFAFYGPIRNMLPYSDKIGRAAGYLAARAAG